MKLGYKQTEVGVIPEEWEVRSLDSIATMVASGRSKAGAAFGSYPVHGSTGIIGFTQKPEYEGDAILAARVGANAGKLNFVTGRYGVTDNTIMLRLSSECCLPFFWRQLETKRLNSLVFGSGQPLITGTQLKALRLVVPSLSEQRAIAEALGDVDALVGALDSLIAKKNDLKQAAMQQLLTGQTRLAGFKGKWEVKTFGELFNFSGGYSASREQLSSEGHCYLHYGDIHKSSKTFVDVRAEYQDIPKLDISLSRVSPGSLLNDGDVVFVDASEDDAGTSKHVIVVNKEKRPFISGLHTIVAKSKTSELAHEYRRYCFQTKAIREQFLFYSVGTKVSGISKSNIPKLKLPVPSVPEQATIAGVLSEMDAELAGLERRREKTVALKEGMMHELLTGRTRLV
jgi:type I restriction enzyme S subunit